MKIVFMKRIVYGMLALIFMLMPSLVKAQGDLAAFDLKGKVKQCTWVNHKAGCIYQGFSKDANKEVLLFAQNGRCLKWNGGTFVKMGGDALYSECSRDAKGVLQVANFTRLIIILVVVKIHLLTTLKVSWQNILMRMLECRL